MKKELQHSDYVLVKMFPILYHLFIKERAYLRKRYHLYLFHLMIVYAIELMISASIWFHYQRHG